MDEIRWIRHEESDKRPEFEWFYIRGYKDKYYIGTTKYPCGYADTHGLGTWFVYAAGEFVRECIPSRQEAEELCVTEFVARRLTNG